MRAMGCGIEAPLMFEGEGCVLGRDEFLFFIESRNPCKDVAVLLWDSFIFSSPYMKCKSALQYEYTIFSI